MKLKTLKLVVFIFFIFFTGPLCVYADFGDVRYDITDVNLKGTKITFKGWAFIHKTNNYTSIEKANLHGGDQKILMRAIKDNGEIIETKVVSGSNRINYNFYCELFSTDEGVKCNETNYKNVEFNKCDEGSNHCYYEDIYFEISFDISDSTWSSIEELDNIKFELAVSNADFESERRKVAKVFEYDHDNDGTKDYFTYPISVSITSASVGKLANDFITIDNMSLDDRVVFIASHGFLRDASNISNRFKYNPDDSSSCAYGEFRSSKSKKYNLKEVSNYNEGRSSSPETDRCKKFLGSDCKGTYNYALSVSNIADYYSGNENFACKTVAVPGSGKIAIARGSHIQISGDTIFKIIIKKRSVCPVVTPSNKDLNCNDSKTFNSTCDTLTISIPEGTANVKIEQTGTISSVLTPDNLFAGGGFNFAVMYQNTIRWTYVDTIPNNNLHNKIKKEMEAKIYSYNEYISRININQLKLGSKTYDSSFLEKKCTTSSNSNDYYNNELTVSCVFSFPESVLHYDGDVEYKIGTGTINVNNKYYTPIDYSGTYKLEATIEGMSRITDESARNDSEDYPTFWTGNWSDTFKNCEINLYSLLLKNTGKYNFIYRPIDISNPFPNRNAGINWYDWISILRNQERLKNTYNDPNNIGYTAVFDNKTISDIKKYNKDNSYIKWDSISSNGTSSFVDSYVTRESGNQ